LNAEFMGGEVIGGAAFGAGAGADGIDRSRRSPRPEEDAAGLEGSGDVKDEKSPRPLGGLVVRTCACEYGGDFGFESKKLPPPPNMFEEDVVGGDFALVKLSRPENGDGLTTGCAAWLNDMPPNASFMPPKADC
jgi:hypothetical protein